MYEYDIYHKITGEHRITFGYWVEEMWSRYPTLNPNEWTIQLAVYID